MCSDSTPTVPTTPVRRRFQFSLSWLVAALLLLGPVLGIGVPATIRWLDEWWDHESTPAPAIPSAVFDSMPVDYYESAETPLD